MENINMAEFGLLNQYAAFAEEYKREYIVGRILSQEKGLYRLISEKGEQSAVASGKLRYNAKSASDFPAVGDFVLIDCNNMQGHAVIHNILPRKSVFIRKAAGTAHTEQIVAANIDTVFICMSRQAKVGQFMSEVVGCCGANRCKPSHSLLPFDYG